MDGIRTALVMLIGMIGMYVIVLDRNEDIARDVTMFWLSMLFLALGLADGVFSWVTKVAYAKGSVISQKDSPVAFAFSIALDVVVVVVAVVGIVFYF